MSDLALNENRTRVVRKIRKICRALSQGVVLAAVSITILAPLAAVSQSNSPAALGMQAYNSSNFAVAKTQLELAVQQYPKSAQLQYVLGNTYFQLGDRGKASQAYEACLAASPSPTIAAYCQKMLAHSKPGGASTNPSGAANSSGSGKDASTATAASSASGGDDDDAKPVDPTKAKFAARKTEIMKRAQEECAKIRKEKDAAILEAESNGNRWTKYAEENTVRPTITADERASISNDFDKRMTRIMDDAKRQANSLGN